MSGYISPVPVEEDYLDYRARDNLNNPTRRRVHKFPRNEGGPCEPARCRECWREKNWVEGQTHG